MSKTVNAVRITAQGSHCFFGYYDVPAFSRDGAYHLCHRVAFYDRLPMADDVAEIGVIDIVRGGFRPLGDTTAWNFQQGSMLQWHPAYPDDRVIYNERTPDGYRAVVVSRDGTRLKQLDLPVANVDPTGRLALSVSFERMFDFRPGYGYAGREDSHKRVDCPDEDGVYVLNLETGAANLVLSHKSIWELTGYPLGGQRKKLLVNHLTFNPGGTRFVLLARTFPDNENTWSTAVVTVNADGSEPYVLKGYDMASHYHWRDAEHLLIYANGDAGPQLYLLKDKSTEYDVIDEGYFERDGHCSYSPDRRWILYDSYPDVQGLRHVYMYHVESRTGKTLGSYYSSPEITGDIRCDLHPRWDRTGSRISFDSIHEGHRGIYLAELSGAITSYSSSERTA